MSNTEVKNTEEKVLPLALTFNINYEILENLIVTALEGGSNYWYHLGRPDQDVKTLISPHNRKGPLSSAIATELLENPDFSVEIFDIETMEDDLEESKLGELNQAAILKGLTLASKDYNLELMYLLTEDPSFDANTADTLFQLCIMGDVVYG